MRMDELPALGVDWESGEGTLRMGGVLRDAPLCFRLDVLADWKEQIDQLYSQAKRELRPDEDSEQLRRQRVHNARRRILCGRLAGQTIELVESLVNGDLLLHLHSGRAVVMYAKREDVKIDLVADVSRARRCAFEDNTGDYYVREEGCEDVL